jgi:hypothetical protein
MRGATKEASSSFLKKRTKKLSFPGPYLSGKATPPMNESLLLLFFRKEVLP